MTHPSHKWLKVTSFIGALALLLAAIAFVPAQISQAQTTPDLSLSDAPLPNIPERTEGRSDAGIGTFAPTCTTVCYVDDTGNDANDGQTPGTALASIQLAVDTVSSGGTVIVGDGDYFEQVIIATSLTLQGPQVGVAGTDPARGTGEATLYPATSNGPGDFSGTYIILANDVDVTVEGFTFDGDLTAPVPENSTELLDGTTADADAAVYFDAGNGEQMNFDNNIVRNFAAVGYYPYYYGYGSIDSNLFDNISLGRAVITNVSFYGDFTNNTVLNTETGIQTNNQYLAHPTGATTQITNNFLEVHFLGVYYNLHYSNAADYNVANNTITGSVYEPIFLSRDSHGIRIQSQSGTVHDALFQNNNISNLDVGVWGWNMTTDPLINPVTVDGGTIENVDVGITVLDCSPQFGGNASGVTTLTVQNTTIRNASEAGLQAYDNYYATITSSSSDCETDQQPVELYATGVVIESSGVAAQVKVDSTAPTVEGEASLFVDASVATNNTTGVEVGPNATANSAASFTNGCLTNNVAWGANNNIPGTITVDATSNWWGAASGPSGAGPGTGDAVSTGVDFATFQTTAPTVAGVTCGGGNVYVDFDAGGLNNGTSWANAFDDLQSAIAAVTPGGAIRIAGGSYYPNGLVGGGSGNADTFNLPSDVLIYGGYAGAGEPDPSLRDPDVYVTTLDGEGVADHVVTANGTTNTTLDGVTITGGDAGTADNGGGILFTGGTTAAINNVILDGNSAQHGGGAYSDNSSPTLTNVIFRNNSASNGGSGGGGGGFGIRNGGSPTLINVLFENNVANGWGGAIQTVSTGTNATVINATFYGNSARPGGNGDAINIANDSNGSFTNIVVWGNGPVANNVVGLTGAGASADFTTSLLEEDCAAASGASLADCSRDAYTTANIGVDPQYIDAANGNYYLNPASVGVDAGTDGVNTLPTDLNGRARLFDIPNPPAAGTSLIDLGAFESSFPVIDLDKANGRQYFGCGRSGTEGICYFPTTIAGRVPEVIYSYTVVMQQQAGISHTFYNSWDYNGTGGPDEFYIGVYRNDTLNLVNRAMDLANPQTIEFTIYDPLTQLCVRSVYTFTRTNKGLSGDVSIVSESIPSDCSGGLAGDALYYDDNPGNDPTP